MDLKFTKRTVERSSSTDGRLTVSLSIETQSHPKAKIPPKVDPKYVWVNKKLALNSQSVPSSIIPVTETKIGVTSTQIEKTEDFVKDGKYKLVRKDVMHKEASKPESKQAPSQPAHTVFKSRHKIIRHSKTPSRKLVIRSGKRIASKYKIFHSKTPKRYGISPKLSNSGKKWVSRYKITKASAASPALPKRKGGSPYKLDRRVDKTPPHIYQNPVRGRSSWSSPFSWKTSTRLSPRYGWFYLGCVSLV